jgi:phosphoribosylformylglycinamidine cyclo-ligase
MSTDGVGTQIVIARAANRHNTIGIDLVAMVIDDLVVMGAEPLFMTDYIATGKVVPERIAEIVAGISEGCVLAGCALVGGETAEHPGVMDPEDYDLSGAGVGIVEADEMLGPERVRPGDALVAMGSSGLHANGYSLVRHVLFERAGLALDVAPPELSGRLSSTNCRADAYTRRTVWLARAVECTRRSRHRRRFGRQPESSATR